MTLRSMCPEIVPKTRQLRILPLLSSSLALLFFPHVLTDANETLTGMIDPRGAAGFNPNVREWGVDDVVAWLCQFEPLRSRAYVAEIRRQQVHFRTLEPSNLQTFEPLNLRTTEPLKRQTLPLSCRSHTPFVMSGLILIIIIMLRRVLGGGVRWMGRACCRSSAWRRSRTSASDCCRTRRSCCRRYRHCGTWMMLDGQGGGGGRGAALRLCWLVVEPMLTRELPSFFYVCMCVCFFFCMCVCVWLWGLQQDVHRIHQGRGRVSYPHSTSLTLSQYH